MAKVLELDKITKSYGKIVKTQVLHGISFDLEEGSFTSIIGQSGSGKSTLMNIIGTLDRPDDGRIVIYGKDTKAMDKRALATLRNETIGFIFQHHYLLPEFTALENILMPYRIRHNTVSEAAMKHALELIDFVGLTHVKDNLANEMSGGQQQRTAIARALMNRPKLILADEPTGALDSDTTEQVYALLRKINKTYKTTFLVITHDKKVAERTDRMIEVMDGRIVLDVTLD